MTTVFSLYVNNKHGTLIYQKDFHEQSASKLTANDKIILASTFHGISGIAAQLTPPQAATKVTLECMRPRGINIIEASRFKFCCFNTPTGLKFFVIAPQLFSPAAAETLCRRSYELYCDYALKNPFYDTDMPIRCATFDKEIKKLYSDYAPDSFGLF